MEGECMGIGGDLLIPVRGARGPDHRRGGNWRAGRGEPSGHQSRVTSCNAACRRSSIPSLSLLSAFLSTTLPKIASNHYNSRKNTRDGLGQGHRRKRRRRLQRSPPSPPPPSLASCRHERLTRTTRTGRSARSLPLRGPSAGPPRASADRSTRTGPLARVCPPFLTSPSDRGVLIGHVDRFRGRWGHRWHGPASR